MILRVFSSLSDDKNLGWVYNSYDSMILRTRQYLLKNYNVLKDFFLDSTYTEIAVQKEIKYSFEVRT